ncbi:MAG: hypothetical protein ACLGI5_09030 [Thermoleophilia bacterium]
MRAQVAVALCLLAAPAAGCGSSGDDDGGATPAVTSAPAAITIELPADGARLKATERKDGLLRARTRVRGLAGAGSAVFLSAACRPAACRAQTRAGDDGRWAATLTLSVARAARFVTIDANAQRDVVAAGSAVATVELVGPARAQRRRSSAGGSSRTGSSGPPAADGQPSRPPSRRTLARDVLVIGDSLALGIEQPLKAALSGWRVRVDGRIGRPLGEGMAILNRESSPPPILAFSLFTNDGPRNTAALEAAVRATATRSGRCVVWATVVRPPLHGVSYDAANALLRRMANDPQLALGLQLVDWAAEVAQSPSLLAHDGVHATPGGYRVLARLYAAAIRSCAGRS